MHATNIRRLSVHGVFTHVGNTLGEFGKQWRCLGVRVQTLLYSTSDPWSDLESSMSSLCIWMYCNMKKMGESIYIQAQKNASRSTTCFDSWTLIKLLVFPNIQLSNYYLIGTNQSIHILHVIFILFPSTPMLSLWSLQAETEAPANILKWLLTLVELDLILTKIKHYLYI